MRVPTTSGVCAAILPMSSSAWRARERSSRAGVGGAAEARLHQLLDACGESGLAVRGGA